MTLGTNQHLSLSFCILLQVWNGLERNMTDTFYILNYFVNFCDVFHF